jgi:hypothetical protein
VAHENGNYPANHEKEDWINGEKTEDVVAFLDRLYTAKRKVEQRIVVLGGEDDSVRILPHSISLEPIPFSNRSSLPIMNLVGKPA